MSILIPPLHGEEAAIIPPRAKSRQARAAIAGATQWQHTVDEAAHRRWTDAFGRQPETSMSARTTRSQIRVGLAVGFS